MPVPVISKHNTQPCQKSFMTLKRSLACITSRRYRDVPFFREVVRRVVGLEMDPLPCSQVQPVQVCAVDVARCPSKHVQKAVYNYHCLKEKYINGVYRFVYPLYRTGFWKNLLLVPTLFLQYTDVRRLPVRRFCWASSPDSWAATIACTSRYKRVHHCRYSHQRGSRCHRTPGGCCRAKQLMRHSHKHIFHTLKNN